MMTIREATIRGTETTFNAQVPIGGHKLVGFIFPANLTARTFTIIPRYRTDYGVMRDAFGGAFNISVAADSNPQVIIVPQDVTLGIEWADTFNIQLNGAVSSNDITVKVLLWDGK